MTEDDYRVHLREPKSTSDFRISFAQFNIFSMRMHNLSKNYLSRNRCGKYFLLISTIVLLNACHHKIDPTENPNFTTPPRVKPTTEEEYLISQSQLPKFLRSDSNDVVVNIRDAFGQIHVISHSDEDGSNNPRISPSSNPSPAKKNSPSSTAPHAPSTSASASDSADSTGSDSDILPQSNTISANALLSINPSSCTWAAQNTPFKGTYASETWTSHDTLYTIIITSHTIDLNWVRDELHKCMHFQVHRISSIQTIDRQYEHSVMLSAPFIAEYTAITSASTGDSQQKEISQSFTRRLITTLADRNVSIQVNTTIDHPFTQNDIIQENNLLFHQIQNIPKK